MRINGPIHTTTNIRITSYNVCYTKLLRLLSAFKKVSAEENQQSYQDKLPENYEEEED